MQQQKSSGGSRSGTHLASLAHRPLPGAKLQSYSNEE